MDQKQGQTTARCTLSAARCTLPSAANFLKKVRFLLNIPAKYGIIQTAIEMAGI